MSPIETPLPQPPESSTPDEDLCLAAVLAQPPVFRNSSVPAVSPACRSCPPAQYAFGVDRARQRDRQATLQVLEELAEAQAILLELARLVKLPFGVQLAEALIDRARRELRGRLL